MSRKNRGALTNLQHILYDIVGNILVYGICILLFEISGGANKYITTQSIINVLLYITVYVSFGYGLKLYDVSIFYYPDRVVQNIMLGAGAATATVVMIFNFFGEKSAPEYYITYFILSFLMLLFTTYISFSINSRFQSSVKTLLIGDKHSFDKFNGFIKKTNMPFKLAGYFKIESIIATEEEKEACLTPAGEEKLTRIICDQAIDQVYIMQDSAHPDDIKRCIEVCMELGIVTRVIIPAARTDRTSYISSVGTYPLITYHMGSLNTGERALKRVLDILGAVIAAIIFSPVILLTAIAVKCTSHGPVFSPQIKVGYNGHKYKVYQFRTTSDSSKDKKSKNLAYDTEKTTETTRLGRFLLKTEISEIPQLLNVLKGEMSIVGIKPSTIEEVNAYSREHWRKLRTKPGIIGLWSKEKGEKLNTFEEIVKLDVEYIESWSLFKDMKIIFSDITSSFIPRR